jgi:hypothetical protein
MQRSAVPNYQNIRGEQRANMSVALALIQDDRSAAAFVGDRLHEKYGPLKGTTKHVARAANSNLRSAENWLQKTVCPGVPRFLRLAMQVPELKSAVKWLLDHGMDHPDAARIIGRMEKLTEREIE